MAAGWAPLVIIIWMLDVRPSLIIYVTQHYKLLWCCLDDFYRRARFVALFFFFNCICWVQTLRFVQPQDHIHHHHQLISSLPCSRCLVRCPNTLDFFSSHSPCLPRGDKGSAFSCFVAAASSALSTGQIITVSTMSSFLFYSATRFTWALDFSSPHSFLPGSFFFFFLLLSRVAAGDFFYCPVSYFISSCRLLLFFFTFAADFQLVNRRHHQLITVLPFSSSFFPLLHPFFFWFLPCTCLHSCASFFILFFTFILAFHSYLTHLSAFFF